MFERFTGQTREAIIEAQAEARELGHEYLGTEHLLLGLLRTRAGVAYEVLTAAGVSYEAARRVIVDRTGPGLDTDALATIGIDIDAVRRTADRSFGSGAFDQALGGDARNRRRPRFTPEAKRAVELALREAIGLEHRHIGSEHVLLAVAREERWLASQVIKQLAPEADLRALIIERLPNAS